MQLLAYVRQNKILEFAVIVIAMVHMVPLASILTPMTDFASDTCKLESPYALIALQALLSLFLIVGVLTRNSDLIFPFMCMFFGIYILFVPYNFIELLPKLLSMPDQIDRFPIKRIGPLVLGMSNGVIILCGIILYYFYEVLLEEKFRSVSLGPHGNQQGRIAIKIHVGTPKPIPQTNQQ